MVLAKEYVPKVRFQDEFWILLGLRSAVQPNVSCEFEVSDLDVEIVADPCTAASGYSLVLTEDYRRK